MRGAQRLELLLFGLDGIIPADAGSTNRACTASNPFQDHPRGCGEHFGQVWQAIMGWGSSPRMRGAQIASIISHNDERIIPADAGSTLKDPCNPNNMIDKISDF